MPLLLASASPRRKELLAAAGIPLLVQAVPVDESLRGGERDLAYLERVVDAKLRAAQTLAVAQGPNEPQTGAAAVLVADTIVSLAGAILDKPDTEAAARRVLERLSNQTHDVRTRFLIGRVGGPLGVAEHAETVTTRVTFRELGDQEIAAYAAGGEGFDKAGGYAIQGGAAGFVARIDGSYTSVVGLPVAEVLTALRTLGLWG